MSDYTPKTERVRELYSTEFPGLGPDPDKAEEFDRWLEGIKAEAWAQGSAVGHSDATNSTFTPNPYIPQRERELHRTTGALELGEGDWMLDPREAGDD